MAPASLAADCQLTQLSSEEGRRQLRSADSRTCHQANLQQHWWPMFLGCRHLWKESMLSAQGCGTAFQLVLDKRTRLWTV